MDQGKEKGYLTYGEVNDLLPGDMHSADDLDDLMTTINTQGIDVLEGEPKFAGARSSTRSTAKRAKTLSWTSRREHSKRPTTPSACICARWARCRC